MEDVVRYHVTDGDVIFIHADAIDFQALQHSWFKDKNIVFVPVMVPPGQTVADCVAVASRHKYWRQFIENNLAAIEQYYTTKIYVDRISESVARSLYLRWLDSEETQNGTTAIGSSTPEGAVGGQ